ncbi:ethyl acetate hydrolase-like [Physella acuta]|uniref:ethyl acetate hydrolase-like n=1 Tax=Physella acuta TaxID=109671 RepID=UPI0027DB0D92|nr:ethyl acetate hydrolase-like [Physella acuta]
MANERDIWAPFSEKYKVHEESYEFLRQAMAANMRPYPELGVEKAREQADMRTKYMCGDVEFQGEVSEIIIPSPYSSEGIPASIYKPASSPEIPVILVYFHGGGLVVGTRDMNKGPLKIIAQESGAVVVNVEYRLLPNPDAVMAPFDDAVVATKWVLENKEVVGGKLGSKVGVGGDSAGGQIAASVTNDVTGLDFQILVYPMTDTTLRHESFQEFKKVPGLNEDAIKWFFENSLLHIPDYTTNPRVNAMVRTNTEASPPGLILLAELDPLVGCGLDYAEKLRAAGVSVQVEVIQGVPHAFFSLREIFKTTTQEAYAHVVTFLKKRQQA